MRRFYGRRSPGSLAVSIAIHVVAITALFQLAFRYPLGQLLGIPEPEVTQERLQYITVPQQPEHSGGGRSADPERGAEPAPLPVPGITPRAIPAPPRIDSARAQAAGARGTGLGISGSGLATGIEPRAPDPRIPLNPGMIARAPRTVAEDVDSIVDLAIGIVRDSMAIAAGDRKPGEWTVRGKGGVWGWDEKGIRLGKFTIPQALLALLPLNVSAQSPIDIRNARYIRNDIMQNAQRQISEDEFREAIKRIRERKEREERDRMLAAEKKPESATP
jgi:hypothetical protein